MVSSIRARQVLRWSRSLFVVARLHPRTPRGALSLEKTPPFSVGTGRDPDPIRPFLCSVRGPFFWWAKAVTPIPCISVSQSACIWAHSVKLGAMPGDSGLPGGIRHEVLHTPSQIHKCLHKRTLLSAQEKCITVLSVPVPPLATLRDTSPHPSRDTSPARRRPRNRAREAVAGD
jgi:hypothetical protein